MLSKVGNDDATLDVRIGGPKYARMMGYAWVAYQVGEITELTQKAYLDRGLQPYQPYQHFFESIATRKRA